MSHMDVDPAVTSPVMRVIGVADAARSVAFYRDVLAFEIREEAGITEAVRGPAWIQLGAHDYAPDNWEKPRPLGSSILFFQTEDVAAMRAAVLARGGMPSEMEKVNWIKMQMFQVLDPDGHALWFGQSYDEPDRVRSTLMMREALPELPFSDVAAAVAYYRDVLGFAINYQQDDLGVMFRDKVTILLIARTERHTGIGSFGVYVEDADALYRELHAKGAHVQGEPVSHPWGLRNFQVLDPEGNRITFSQAFE